MTMPVQNHDIARVLPDDAVALLRAAAQTDGPVRRMRAIDSAVAHIKARHPKYFRADEVRPR